MVHNNFDADIDTKKKSIDDSQLVNSSSDISTIEPEAEPLSWRFWRKRRYIVVLLAFFGFFNVYSLRVNLSVAIVAMTENRTIYAENGTVIGYDQYFDWTSTEQGLILSSFFYGYILTQLCGGYLASRIGGNVVFGTGIFVTALLTLLTPLAANSGVGALMTIRVIEGIFEGVTFPCIHAVWSQWAPPLERTRMATMAFAGTYAGTVVAMPACGLLSERYGWESLFYVFGGIGCVWYVIWMIVVRKAPQCDTFISKDELRYIQQTLSNTSEQKTIVHPWKSIFTSKPVYAITASHFSENWGFYTLLTQLPTFLKDTLKFDLSNAGFLSAVPYLVMGILLGVSGYLADLCQVRKWLTTSQVRKYFNCTAFLAQTTFMILAAYLLEPVGSVLCITIAVGLGAFAWCGFAVNHLDVAPNHASVLMGISNTFATIPGIISPTLTGYIVQNKSPDEWRIVFYITAGVYLFGAVVYWFWSSGEVQPWAKLSQVDNFCENEAIEDKEQNKKGHVNEAADFKE